MLLTNLNKNGNSNFSNNFRIPNWCSLGKMEILQKDIAPNVPSIYAGREVRHTAMWVNES